jgi:hypothetical protein
MEAELTAFDTTTVEAKWLCELLMDFAYCRETFADNTYEL